MTTHLPPHQIGHRSWSTYDDVRSDSSRVSRKIFLDSVLRLDICEFPHGYYHRHDLPSKFAGRG